MLVSPEASGSVNVRGGFWVKNEVKAKQLRKSEANNRIRVSMGAKAKITQTGEERGIEIYAELKKKSYMKRAVWYKDLPSFCYRNVSCFSL